MEEVRELHEGNVATFLERAREEENLRLASLACTRRLAHFENTKPEETARSLGVEELGAEASLPEGAIGMVGMKRPNEVVDVASGEGHVSRTHERFGSRRFGGTGDRRMAARREGGAAAARTGRALFRRRLRHRWCKLV